MYHKTFSDKENRQKYLKWRIQFLERSIRKLDFGPSGICTIVQVNDSKSPPGLGKRGLGQATKQALQLLQDNYTEFVAKQVFINVPWWYLAVNRMISPFLTQRIKSKFVFVGPSKFAVTLLRSPPNFHLSRLILCIWHVKFTMVAAKPPLGHQGVVPKGWSKPPPMFGSSFGHTLDSMGMAELPFGA